MQAVRKSRHRCGWGAEARSWALMARLLSSIVVGCGTSNRSSSSPRPLAPLLPEIERV